MDIFKKTFLLLLLILGFSTFFITDIFASTVDIFLKETQESKEITVLADSNREFIPGVDITIIFSENVFIQSLSNGDYCNLFFDVIISENEISLECFNDLNVNLDGPLLSIEYISDSDDYYFYVNERNIDFGGPVLGNVENINKPDFVEKEIEEGVEQEYVDSDYGVVDTVIDFLRINSLYILGVVMILVIVILGVFVFDFKKEENPK